MGMIPDQKPSDCEDIVLNKFLDFIFDQGIYQRENQNKSDRLFANIETKSFESLLKIKGDKRSEFMQRHLEDVVKILRDNEDRD